MKQFEKNVAYEYFEVSIFSFLYRCKLSITESFMTCSIDLPDFPVEQVDYQVIQQIIYKTVQRVVRYRHLTHGKGVSAYYSVTSSHQIQARMLLAFSATWALCQLLFSQLPTNTLRSFSDRQLYSPSSPSL